MSVFPKVVVEQAHSSAWALTRATAATMNPANPADSSLEKAANTLRGRGFEVVGHESGHLDEAALSGADVLVIDHPAERAAEKTTGDLPPVLEAAEIDSVVGFVEQGGGLVVLAECDQDVYGNNLNELLARFGLHVTSTTVHETVEGGRRFHDNATWVLADIEGGLGQGLLAGVDELCFYRAGVIDISGAPEAKVLARTSGSAYPARQPLAVALPYGAGRVVVLADSDIVGDDSIDELDHRRFWSNLVTWASAARKQSGTVTSIGSGIDRSPEWLALKAAVEELRLMQAKDGSVEDGSKHARAAELVDTMKAEIAALAPRFPHDADYLAQLPNDLAKWVDNGFVEPDFLDSLMKFRPDLSRADGIEHLVVFPMYTQNGNLDRVFEALLISVQWPDWLAELEQTYDNKMFLAVNFIDFTPGYDTNSAVLFPETVAVREVPKFSWGAIFCDREGARFRRVVSAASELLSLQLPPDAERLIASQELVQSTFAMWDMIHDRTHSHGDLPFDPFMIKQRMPFWMYALEELRCDLNTFRQAVKLEAEDQPYARFVQLAILFDRLFRFPITGDRHRNYDGLGGQLMFGYLHKHDALRWTDNKLSFDWRRVPEVIVQLCDEVEVLYRSGIDRSRVGHWLAAHEFVATYVVPNPGSTWAKGAEALPFDGTKTKALNDLVLDDEFPLNVFYEALRKQMASVIASTSGITASTADAA
ncbi:hypothetical protein GCM10011492_38720 [Flexivirga endophytica]|uniref:DUF4350 domain-containing protein n=1 Tax=Flexivirga endophytica TaxID=1849103 RepID=A0A916WZ81_9MICO|nr:DUF6421 family protein [Flexivirga endophytica]GGB43922.1 hypothetical protein GCM10011492_38720 [Flexivirga endophytica]GHB67894.1 hypothetical protein GCM10008112_40780 [Flexivirga endophytica]